MKLLEVNGISVPSDSLTFHTLSTQEKLDIFFSYFLANENNCAKQYIKKDGKNDFTPFCKIQFDEENNIYY